MVLFGLTENQKLEYSSGRMQNILRQSPRANHWLLTKASSERANIFSFLVVFLVLNLEFKVPMK